MLDSGEADEWLVELDPEGERQFLQEQRAGGGEQATVNLEPGRPRAAPPLGRMPMFLWKGNPRRKALLDNLPLDARDRVGRAQGVFLKCHDPRVGDFCGFFVNTNKTADIDKDWHHRGYRIEWQHDSLLRILVKLRNWQRRYNPITRPTIWTELETKHIGNAKSHARLREAAPTCFLFRDASAQGKRDKDARKPITFSLLESLWTKLLAEFEIRKAAANETDAAGQPLRFFKVRRRSVTSSTPTFPLHALRCSLITALADGGMSLGLLMKLAGHTRLVMTIYYRKLSTWQMNEAMREAQANLAKRGDAATIAWLKGKTYQDLPKHVVGDDDGLRAALASDPDSRNAAGWERQLGGWCLMGGNTAPSSEQNSCGGCFNGGPLIKEGQAKHNRVHAPVRPKACIESRCRWFVTRPEYIFEIRSKLTLLCTRLSSVQRLLETAEDELMQLQRGKIRAEREDKVFAKLDDFRRVELLRNRLSTDIDELLHGISNCAMLADRVLSIAMIDGEEPGTQLVAQGTREDVKWAFEAVDSELLQLSDVCLNAEVFPELEPESEAAIRARGQLFDQMLQRIGKGLVFAGLKPEEQLRVGNRMMRELARPLGGDWGAAVRMLETNVPRLMGEALQKVLPSCGWEPTQVSQLIAPPRPFA